VPNIKDTGKSDEEIANFSADIAKWKPLASGSSSPSLANKLRDHERSLKRLQAERGQPVRIAVLGRFASGKTTVLGALTGTCGLLPIAENPTTGNLVEISLHRGDSSLQEARLRNWRVQIVDRATAELILSRLLSIAAGLLELEWPAGRELLRRAQNPKSPSLWTDAVNWAIAARAKEHTPKLRAVAFEVYRFARIFEQLLHQSGCVLPVSEAHAHRLMTLEDNPGEIYDGDLHAIPRLASGSGELSFERFTDNELRAVFPAIRKILVDADLPNEVANRITTNWQLNFQLVDAPGSGADGSSIRDEAIAAVELRNVDIVLAVTNSRLPGDNQDWNSDITRTWGLEGKSRVHTAINRFDELPISAELPILERLASQSEPVSFAELRNVCAKTLFVLLEAARRQVLDRDYTRITLLSSMAVIDKCQAENVRLGTGEFLRTNVNGSNRDWRVRQRMWQALGQKLQGIATTDEERAISRLLLDFGDDGGGRRLLKGIADHIAASGIKDRNARQEKEWAEFHSEHEELRKQMSELGAAAPTDETAAAGEAVVVWLERGRQAYQDVLAGLNMMAPQLKIRSGRQKIPVGIVPAIEREAIGRVCDWDYWRDTLNLIDPNREPCLIPPCSAEELARRPLKPRIPLKSDDFVEPFQKTCEELIQLVNSLLPSLAACAIDDVRERILQRLGNDQTRLHDALRRAVDDESLRQQLGESHADFARAVRMACEESDLEQEVTEQLRELLERCRSEAMQKYPLQQNLRGSRAVVYPWNQHIHDRYRLQFETRHRHVMRIYRLRFTLIEAILFYLRVTLSELAGKLHDTVAERVAGIQKQLQNAAQAAQRTIPDQIAGENLVNSFNE
jgi:hypothetical protein